MFIPKESQLVPIANQALVPPKKPTDFGPSSAPADRSAYQGTHIGDSVGEIPTQPAVGIPDYMKGILGLEE